MSYYLWKSIKITESKISFLNTSKFYLLSKSLEIIYFQSMLIQPLFYIKCSVVHWKRVTNLRLQTLHMSSHDGGKVYSSSAIRCIPIQANNVHWRNCNASLSLLNCDTKGSCNIRRMYMFEKKNRFNDGISTQTWIILVVNKFSP